MKMKIHVLVDLIIQTLSLGNWMYGHSYVSHQRMNQVYAPEMGLKMGTIFPELVSPYCPGQSMEVNKYLASTNKIGEGCNG